MSKNKVTVNFGLVSVKTKEWSFNSGNINPENPELFFGINTKVEIINERKAVIIEISIAAYSDAANKNNVFSILTGFEFGIQNFEDFLKKEDEKLKVNFPFSFIVNLVAISLSTTRGILLEKLSSTELSAFILPIIDPTDLISEIKAELTNIPVE